MSFILCNKTLLDVLHNMSLIALLLWKHPGFQTYSIAKYFWPPLGFHFDISVVPHRQVSSIYMFYFYVMWGECMTSTILSLACLTHFLNLNISRSNADICKRSTAFLIVCEIPYYSPGHSGGKRLIIVPRKRSAQVRTLKIIVFHRGFRSVVVITTASHAEGRRFEPGRKNSFSLLASLVFFFVCEYLDLFIFMDCFRENTKSNSISLKMFSITTSTYRI